MELEKQMQRAARAATISYMTVGSFEDNAPGQVILYRSACIALDAVTLVEVTTNLVETKPWSYFDEDIWSILGETAESRRWEAYCLKEIGDSPGLSRRCIDAGVEAIASSADLYIAAQNNLSDAGEERWGSILDFKSTASNAILGAFDAFEDAEDVYKAAEYPHAVPGYWASYEALRAAGLLMGSYNPSIVVIQQH